jgi:hypothetical protein
MSDLLTLRVARAPQKRNSIELADIQAYPDGSSKFVEQLAAADDPRAVARTKLSEQGLLPPATRLGYLGEVDAFLSRAQNRPSLEDVYSFFRIDEGTAPADFLISWLKERQGLRLITADSLAASLFVEVTPQLRGDLVRTLGIFGLIESIAAEPARFVDPQRIFDTLRWRTLVLPEVLLNIARRLGGPGRAVSRQGIADLFVVRNEWISYKAGELAHIENVLPGELKERKHFRVDETETTTTTETQTTTTNERDSQSTDRFEMKDEASRDVELAVHVEAQVDTSGQYGPTKVDSHIGGSLDYSQHDSSKRATTQAKETISRAVVKVEQTVRSQRVQRSLTRVEDTDTHSLKNEASAPLSGMYRWVDKVVRFQVFRYPNRYLLEFQVPEPAAWLRWLHAKKKGLQGVTAEAPLPFTPSGSLESPTNLRLTPSAITEDNYLAIGARYYAMGLKPPPRQVLVSAAFEQDTVNPRDTDKIKSNDPVRFLKAADISIPAGYRATRWHARVHGWGEASYNKGKVYASILIMVGNADGIVVGPDNKSAFGQEGAVASVGPVEVDGSIAISGDTNPGYEQTQLPVSLRLDNVRGYNIHVTVECLPTAATLDAWRIGTYETIAEAYFAMKSRYDDQVATAQLRSGISIEGNSPVRNQQVVQEELKKKVISMFFGEPNAAPTAPYNWPRLIAQNAPTDEPMVRTAEAVARAPMIQFLEQAFEWEKLTYIAYPYYWADRASQWADLADLQSDDPVFAEFLRSGSARTVVSVRPGFEAQVQLFLDFGIIWGGGQAPAPGEPDYLSLSDEIKAIQRGPDDAERLEWWDTRLPTTLLWLQGAAALPEKPEAERELGPTPVVP